jgi:peroxiredoxin
MKRILILIIFSICLGTIHAQDNFTSVRLKTMSGKMVDFVDLIKEAKDTPVVVSFWATWCVPCLNELDNVNDEFEAWQADRPFKLYAVSVDDSRTVKRVKPFIQGKGWKFDVLMDVNSDLKRSLNITDVPHVMIIKNSSVVYRHTGYVVGEEENLRNEIKKF